MRLAWIWCGLLTLALVFTSCGGGGSSADDHPGKVLLIGLDGTEWDLLGPMIEAGEMPNLARIMERGVHGKLRSLEPLAKSPAIWTTIATGKSPNEHGIHTFVDKQNGQPMTQNMRQVRALWNILSGVDRGVGVVGWLMSWPAEEVNGFVVSDYLQYSASRSNRVSHRTYPTELESELVSDVVRWETLPWSFVQRFLDAPLDTTAMDDHLEALLRPMKWFSAGDITFARVAEKLYRRDQPDFMAVYLRGMDAMGHLYWNYMTPEAVPANSLDEVGLEYCRNAMRAYYRYTDELVGPLIDMVDDDTAIIVVSDHGFKGGSGRGVEMHKLDGVILMAGPGVGQGEITGANVFDVTPTSLVLMGLPPAEDMRGKVLWSALDPSISRERFAPVLATYETGDRGADGAPLESPVDEELKERLRSLGYID